MAREIRTLIKMEYSRLEKAGITKGKVPKTNRRVMRELVRMRENTPFKKVMAHTMTVKRMANALAKALQEKGVKLDRGLVNQTALGHDLKREVGLYEHDVAGQEFMARIGAPRVAEHMGHGAASYSASFAKWPLEKKILAWADCISRGVWTGRGYVNGALPSQISYELSISQVIGDKERIGELAKHGITVRQRIDELVKEKFTILRFEKKIRGRGVQLDRIMEEQMQKNPKGFLEAVQKNINPKIDGIIEESRLRQGIPNI